MSEALNSIPTVIINTARRAASNKRPSREGGERAAADCPHRPPVTPGDYRAIVATHYTASDRRLRRAGWR